MRTTEFFHAQRERRGGKKRQWTRQQTERKVAMGAGDRGLRDVRIEQCVAEVG